jgi:hypothetical protein
MRNVEQMETPDYILGYEMGKRIPNGPKLAPPQQSTSLQAPFKIPGTYDKYIEGFIAGRDDATHTGLRKDDTGNRIYDDGYEIGFGHGLGSIEQQPMKKQKLDQYMKDAENDFVRDAYEDFKKGGKSKTKKGGKLKRGGGKSKKRGGKTKKRNQKK